MITKIHSTRVLIEEELREATISLENGKISDITYGPSKADHDDIINYGDAVIMPGLIDSHVHINEPGRTDWEGFDSGTKAAAAGGITSIVDMPLNSSPVTTSVDALSKKITATHGKLHVNCGFWGGLVPENAHDLEVLLSSGILGIKAFLTHSGIDEFPNVNEADLRAAMPKIAEKKLTLLAHCELDDNHAQMTEFKMQPNDYLSFLHSRPKSWENNAIEMMTNLAQEYNCPIHIVHLSSTDLISSIQELRTSGLPLTVETCPHYLFFDAEGLVSKGPLYKCAPPIREKANQSLLWDGLKNGVIDFIVTDHSPAPPDLKELESGDFNKAWGGISGLQHSLPVVWTKARSLGFSIIDLHQWMSLNVAKFLHLEHRKGLIGKGYDADLVIWNPEIEFVPKKEDLHYKHKISPYVNEKLFGQVSHTYVNGALVYKKGNFVKLSQGKLILK